MVLVTGASGFLGKHLVRFLSDKGYNVRATYLNNTPDTESLKMKGVSWVRCDLLDVYTVSDIMQGIDEVYHCAAMVSFNATDKNYIQHVNAESTANVVNQALEVGVRKLIFVSPVAALGRGLTQYPITETDQWEENKNNTAYSRSKYLSEMEVWRAIEEGLNAAIVNPAIMLGNGDWEQGSSRLMKVVDNNFPFYTEGVNGWVDVQDVVRAMYLLMQAEVSSERFILSQGSHSYQYIFNLMAQYLVRRPAHIRASPLMTSVLWHWNKIKTKITGKQSSITKETARTAQMKCFYNNDKFLQSFPSFSYTPIEKTIEKMASDYTVAHNR